MTRSPFESYARNGEDVVLWRALGHVPNGRYVDIGAGHPSDDSLTMALYERGWRGVSVEERPELVELQRAARPGDAVIEAKPSDAASLATALEDAGWPEGELHLLAIRHADAMPDIDLPRWRPWVIVVGPGADGTPDDRAEGTLSAAGYIRLLFDGRSTYFVASEREGTLAAHLAVPAHVGDNYISMTLRRLEAERDAAIAQSIHWRTVALERWSARMEEASIVGGPRSAEYRQLKHEITALQSTVSWRVTKPLRTLRKRFPTDKGGG